MSMSIRDAIQSTVKGQELIIEAKKVGQEIEHRADTLQCLIADVLVNSQPPAKRYKNLVIKADVVTYNLAKENGDDYNHLLSMAKFATGSIKARNELISCLEDLVTQA